MSCVSSSVLASLNVERKHIGKTPPDETLQTKYSQALYQPGCAVKFSLSKLTNETFFFITNLEHSHTVVSC